VAQENEEQKIRPALIRGPDNFVTSYDVGEVYHRRPLMATKKTKTEPLVFHIDFQKGKANRNRLPLADVIATLQEFDLMVKEVGRKIQRDRGVENPTGDFGIELLAGPDGIAFEKGSVKTAAAPTKDVENAERTLASVIATTAALEKKRPTAVDEYGAPVLRRLTRVGNIQENNHTELRLGLVRQGRVIEHTTFSEKGVSRLRALSASDLAIYSVTVYGKLRRLADFAKDEDSSSIWGELVDDTGEVWRVHFRQSDLKAVQTLFTKQVVVHGNANYFKAKNPRLDANAVAADVERKYVSGFTRFRKNYRDIFGDRDPEEILKEIRG
jgi:hypothetical protein